MLGDKTGLNQRYFYPRLVTEGGMTSPMWVEGEVVNEPRDPVTSGLNTWPVFPIDPARPGPSTGPACNNRDTPDTTIRHHGSPSREQFT